LLRPSFPVGTSDGIDIHWINKSLINHSHMNRFESLSPPLFQ
jgi:hypothetical protein